MKPSPAVGVIEQLLEHPDIPGKCSHGLASVVPEFVSDPEDEA
jgi:hypothetical protein